MIPQNDKDFYEFLKVYSICLTISDKDKKVLSLLINTPGHIRRDRVVGTDEYWPTDENGEMVGPRYKRYALEFVERSLPILRDYNSPSRLLALKMIQEDIYVSAFARLTDEERTRVDLDSKQTYIKKRGSGPNLEYEKISENIFKIWLPDTGNSFRNNKNQSLLKNILRHNNVEILRVESQKYFVIRYNDIEKIAIELSEKFNDNVNGLLRNLSGIIFEVFCVGTCPICDETNFLCHITRMGDLVCNNGHTGEIKLRKEQAVKCLEKHDYVSYAHSQDGVLYPRFVCKNVSNVFGIAVTRKNVINVLQEALSKLNQINDINKERLVKNRFLNIHMEEDILNKIHKIYQNLE